MTEFSPYRPVARPGACLPVDSQLGDSLPADLHGSCLESPLGSAIDFEAVPDDVVPAIEAARRARSALVASSDEDEFDEDDFDDDFDDDFEDELDEELNDDLDEFDEELDEEEIDGSDGAGDDDAGEAFEDDADEF
jgi:hypothetical protein